MIAEPSTIAGSKAVFSAQPSLKFLIKPVTCQWPSGLYQVRLALPIQLEGSLWLSKSLMLPHVKGHPKFPTHGLIDCRFNRPYQPRFKLILEPVRVPANVDW